MFEEKKKGGMQAVQKDFVQVFSLVFNVKQPFSLLINLLKWMPWFLI